MTHHPTEEPPLEELLMHLAALAGRHGGLPPADTPLGRSTREFFSNNWANACEGLLAKTSRLRVSCEPSPAPRVFRFEVDRPYKCKRSARSPVELAEGPIRGTIVYRPDLLEVDPDEPSIAVMLDRNQCFFHPNFSRRYGLVCLGDLPGGPFPLDALLEHLYGVLSYQNRRPTHPADLEAAAYFAMDPDAMEGLELVEPLF